MATDYTPNVDDITAPTSGHPPYRVFDEIRLLKGRAKGLLDTLLSEIDSRAAADSSLQSQIGGQAPLTSSAFSPISWHAQVIENSVTIPDNVNAWSFGPTMEISEGQVVTVGTGSAWTINH